MLFDEHGEGWNQHGVELTGNALGETVVVGGDETQFLVFHPLLEGNDIFRHVPYLLYGTATLDIKGVKDILCLCPDGSLIGDVIGNRPHLLPVKLFGVEPHTMIQVRLVNIQVHHTGIGTTDLCDVRITETTAYLCGTAPVLNLCLHLRVTTLYDTSDHCRALAGTVQVCDHLTDGATGIQLSQPDGDVRLLIIRSQFLLYVHDDYRYIEVTHCRQHIIRGAIGQHLQDDQVDISGTELITCHHRLLLGGHHTTVNHFHRIGDSLLKCLILCLKLRDKLRKLWQVCSQSDGEHAHPCFCLY